VDDDGLAKTKKTVDDLKASFGERNGDTLDAMPRLALRYVAGGDLTSGGDLQERIYVLRRELLAGQVGSSCPNLDLVWLFDRERDGAGHSLGSDAQLVLLGELV